MEPSKMSRMQSDNDKVEVHPYYDNNGEIDLLELIKIMWAYKWLTIMMCTIAIAGSVFYALNVQERWIAGGEIGQPQFKDVFSFYEKTQTLAAIIGNPDTIKLSTHLQNYFNLFVELFNSPLNKNNFFKNRPEFINYLVGPEKPSFQTV